MSKNNAVNQDYTNNADGWDLTGGTIARKLAVTGANITLTGTGTNVYTFPSATSTLLGVSSVGTVNQLYASQGAGKLAVATSTPIITGLTINETAKNPTQITSSVTDGTTLLRVGGYGSLKQTTIGINSTVCSNWLAGETCIACYLHAEADTAYSIWSDGNIAVSASGTYITYAGSVQTGSWYGAAFWLGGLNNTSSITLKNGRGVNTIVSTASTGAITSTSITSPSGSFSTSLIIPATSDPLVDAAGKIALDSTDGQFLSYDSAVVVMATKKKSVSFVLDAPAADTVFPVCQFPYAVTLTKIWGAVLGGTSLTFNLEERAYDSLNSAGTDTMTSDLVADQNGATTTSFSNSGVAANAFLVLAASAMSGTVGKVAIEIDYVIVRT